MTTTDKSLTTEDKVSFYDFSVEDTSGQIQALSQFKGKVALVVNTASECGFTSQYKGLQKIYEEYKERGLVVLAFPSNDFGQQEPASNSEIKKFCELRYKITFPVFAKGKVKGPNKQPLYKFLTEQSLKDYQGDPGWNFVKFLINKNGEVVGRYSSITSPTSNKIRLAVESALAELVDVAVTVK